jgi:dTDP-glucose 4,6-dehydratase
MSAHFEHILVTGGCGFIGSNFVRYALERDTGLHLTNLDLLTYSGNPENLTDVVDSNGPGGDARYHFVHGDIGDGDAVSQLLRGSLDASDRPPIDAVVHFAAESHVDRSIMRPTPFVRTNVLGTSTLIETCRTLLDVLPAHFRFIHVSTDEVYGSLAASDPPFNEETPLAPNSPYAASKAGSDLLVRSYYKTFDFPAIITRCSNNYGPFQYPEKLIPLMVTTAMRDAPLPVYGDGLNVRDWIHVDDHCAAVRAVLLHGRIGACYNIGGESEMANLDIVRRIVAALQKSESLITFVTDRPGHDRRYAMNIEHIRGDVGWHPVVSFEMGIQSTIEWYLQHEAWWRPLLRESGRVADTMYKA